MMPSEFVEVARAIAARSSEKGGRRSQASNPFLRLGFLQRAA